MGCHAITLTLSLFSPSSLNFPVPLGGRGRGAGGRGGEQSSSSQNQNQISFPSGSTVNMPSTFPWEGTGNGKAEVHFLQADDRLTHQPCDVDTNVTANRESRVRG